MPDIKDKIKQAQSNGYSAKEIADFLSGDSLLAPKIKAARNEGHSDDDIIGYLSTGSPNTVPSSATATTRFPNEPKPTMSLEDAVGKGVPQVMSRLTGVGTFAPLRPEEATLAGVISEIALPFAAMAPGIGIGSRMMLAGVGQAAGTLTRSNLEDIARVQAGGQPTPLKEKAINVIGSGGLAALGEGLGGAVGKKLEGIAAPFKDQLNQDVLFASKRYGIRPLPSEMLNETTTGSNAMQLGENISSKTIGGASIIGKRRVENLAALQNYQEDILAKIAPKTQPTPMRNIVNDIVHGNTDTFRDIAGDKFNAIDSGIAQKNAAANWNTPKIMQTDVSSISTASLKSSVGKILSSIPEPERLAAGKEGASASALVQQLERIQNLPPKISFKDAQFYRSQFLEKVRSGQDPIGDRIRGSAAMLANQLEQKMRSTAKKLGVFDLYRDANDFYRQGVNIFNSDIVVGLAKQDPEKLAEYVFKPQSGENIGKVQEAINPTLFTSIKQNVNADAWQRFKRAGLESLIESNVFQKVNKASGEETMRGANLYQTLKGYGDETLNKWLSPQEKDAIMKFAKVATRVSTEKPTVGLWGTSAVIGAGTAIGTAGIVGRGVIPAITTAGAVLGMPSMYAKLITSDAGRKWLTEGIKIKAGTKEAINFAGRFSAWAAQQNWSSDENK